MNDRELLAQLAYAVTEGKFTEALNLAQEFYRTDPPGQWGRDGVHYRRCWQAWLDADGEADCICTDVPARDHPDPTIEALADLVDAIETARQNYGHMDAPAQYLLDALDNARRLLPEPRDPA